MLQHALAGLERSAIPPTGPRLCRHSWRNWLQTIPAMNPPSPWSGWICEPVMFRRTVDTMVSNVVEALGGTPPVVSTGNPTQAPSQGVRPPRIGCGC